MRSQVVAGSIMMLLAAAVASGATGRESKLIDAVKNGDVAAVRALAAADANATQADGTTALHWAAYNDSPEVVGLLIRAGANVRAVNRYGVAPLNLACVHGNPAVVEALLKAGADSNSTQPSGETALMTASRAGNADTVKLLLAHGADVNARETWKGQTALMWAAQEGTPAVIQALIAGGADMKARSKTSLSLSVQQPGDKSFTPLLFAIRAGKIEAVQTLLAAGGDVNEKVSDGTSGLVMAIMSAQYDMAAFLLDHGADPNAADQGWTALHQVAWTRNPNRGYNTVGPVARGAIDSVQLVKKLVARGANINARMTKTIPSIYTGRNLLNHVGLTPFAAAAHRTDPELMRLLLENGADPKIANEDGTTPLMVAAGTGLRFPGESPGNPQKAAEAVKICLEQGLDPNAVDDGKETALHGAAYWDSPEAIRLLAAAGAKLDAVNERGWTPLRVADGVAITLSLHTAAESAALLRQLLKEQGLPVPAPVVGDGGYKVGESYTNYKAKTNTSGTSSEGSAPPEAAPPAPKRP
jgi:uncharacterized protein